jgi:hypothetical protein
LIASLSRSVNTFESSTSKTLKVWAIVMMSTVEILIRSSGLVSWSLLLRDGS